MALEIQSEIGHQDLKNIGPAAVAQVDRTIVNNIYGGTNYFASGQSHLHATTTQTQNVITVGDKAQLETVLKNCGLSEEDLKTLTEAQTMDGQKKMGTGVMAWVKKAASKVLAGGVSIGAEVGQKLLTEWLKQYYGIQ